MSASSSSASQLTPRLVSFADDTCSVCVAGVLLAAPAQSQAVTAGDLGQAQCEQGVLQHPRTPLRSAVRSHNDPLGAKLSARVGSCRVVSGRVATCRAAPLSLSSSAAECRRGSRSLGHLLGQPLLSQEPFSLL